MSDSISVSKSKTRACPVSTHGCIWDQTGMFGSIKIASGNARNPRKGIIRFDSPERPEGAVKRSALVEPFDRFEAFHPVNHNAKRQSHVAHLTVVLRLFRSCEQARGQ